MTQQILFVTGKLAELKLATVLEGLNIEFDYSIWNAGVKVAALITESIICSRLPKSIQASRIILPGRCRADVARLSTIFGIQFERGPDNLEDLPEFFGRSAAIGLNLTRHYVRLFAEIVDAPLLSIDEICHHAHTLSHAGADVIDLGCLPDTPFANLEQALQQIKLAGYSVSIDSANISELERADSFGADYLLSLTEFNLEVAKRCRPVLVPATHGDLDSLVRAYERAKRLGLNPILDPILDPIHFGFVDSIFRYREMRRRLPGAEMIMGTGNLTEMTEADALGVTAVLIGACSELSIANALTVNVSPHTCRTLQEHDAIRRIMYAAKGSMSPPKGFGGRLLQIHDMTPHSNSVQEIRAAAAQTRDRNFRIEVSTDGLHVYNKNGHWFATNALELFDDLCVHGDGAHAFYLGTELQKAEIAFQLKKRYVQDEPLYWGVAADLNSRPRVHLRKRPDV